MTVIGKTVVGKTTVRKTAVVQVEVTKILKNLCTHIIVSIVGMSAIPSSRTLNASLIAAMRHLFWISYNKICLSNKSYNNHKDRNNSEL